MKVLVTGGASTFGRSTVQRLVKNGATVVFCDQPSSNGEEIAKEIGGSVSYMPADIAKEYDVRNLLKEIQNAHGGLNVLLNCASLEKRQNIYDFAQKRPAQLDDLQAIIKVRYKSIPSLQCENKGNTIRSFSLLNRIMFWER